MSTPDGNGRFIPNGPPRVSTVKSKATPSSGQQVRQFAASVRAKPFENPSQQGRRAARERREARANKTRVKVGGGFNPSVNPTLNISVGGGGAGAGSQGAAKAAGGAKAVPGSDFMSNEDIRAYCEHLRKESRRSAVERALDAEHLEQVLRHIPAADGTRSGSLMRGRRVSRHLKKIARAHAAIAKSAAAAYAQFEREYESELRTISRGRTSTTRTPFSWS